MDKEQIYDAHISPLMAQILAIAKEHQIDFVASFSIPTDADSTLRCTSCALGDDAPKEFEQAHSLVRDGFAAFSATTH
ncbi:hypothetical protein [Burkholderia plantarii]|uniref:hypothetical protein n=1 Tax=Burkholderia plantarii TaxID=41899 RepID=UPI0008706717|nr:hypothetical protein [Burkholderia plantarii]